MPSRKSNRPSSRERLLSRRLKRVQYTNACLRRENASLRRQLCTCRAIEGTDKRPQGDAPVPASLLAERAAAAERLSVRGFWRYLTVTVSGSYPAYLWRRWLRLFRRVRLIRTIITVTATVMASAVLLALLAAVLPFLLTGMAVSVMGIFLTARHRSRKMSAALRGKCVVVMATGVGVRWAENPLLLRTAREWAAAPGYAAVILSPYHLLTSGPVLRAPFLTVRREEPGLYFVRPLYWFALRRVLEMDCRRVTVMY